MSQENVEVVRRGFEHFLATGEPLWETLDEEVVIRDHDIPDSHDYVGYSGLARWREDWDSAWDAWRWEPEEFIDAGDRVIAVLRVYAKGRGSGVDVERPEDVVPYLGAGVAKYRIAESLQLPIAGTVTSYLLLGALMKGVPVALKD